MGTSINSIVKVNITRETAKITQVGFGTALFLTTHALAGQVLAFSSHDAVVAGGFPVGSPAEKAALAYFGQQISPSLFKVGKLSADASQVDHVVVNSAVATTTYTQTINGTTFSFASGSTPTVLAIAAGLVAAINAGTQPVIAALPSIPDGSFTITSTVAGTSFYGVCTPTLMTETTTTANNNVAVGLLACQAVDPDFYAVTLERSSSYNAKAELLMATIESMLKVGFFASSDPNMLTTSSSDIGSFNKTNSFDRNFVFYNGTDSSYPELALLGANLPMDAGSINWKFTQLSGATPDNLSDTAIVNLKAKNINYFETVGGVNILSSDAVMGSGEYIDIIMGIDYMQTQLAQSIFGGLVAVRKLPITDPGIQLAKSWINNVLVDCVNKTIITSDYTITVPKASDISTADKGSRLLEGLTFSAPLQGAANYVGVAGTVSV